MYEIINCIYLRYFLFQLMLTKQQLSTVGKRTTPYNRVGSRIDTVRKEEYCHLNMYIFSISLCYNTDGMVSYDINLLGNFQDKSPIRLQID